MATITTEVEVEVEVYLDEFDLDELLDEIENRYDNNVRVKEKIDCFINGFYGASKMSLLDEMKIDFIKNNIDKIKLTDLENLI